MYNVFDYRANLKRTGSNDELITKVRRRLNVLDENAIKVRRKITNYIKLGINVAIFNALISISSNHFTKETITVRILIAFLIMCLVLLVELFINVFDSSYYTGFKSTQIKLFKREWVLLNNGQIILEEGIKFSELYREALEYNGTRAPFYKQLGLEKEINEEKNLQEAKRLCVDLLYSQRLLTNGILREIRKAVTCEEIQEILFKSNSNTTQFNKAE